MKLTVVLVSLFGGLCFASQPRPAAQNPRVEEPKVPPRSGATRTLTLREALELADKNSPMLRVASASLDGASAAILTAKAYANPSLSFGSLGHQRALLDTSVAGMLHGFNVSQLVELPSVRATRLNAAEMGRQSRQYALVETRLQVRGMVKQAFYEALRQKAALGLAESNLQLLEDLRRRIQVQVEVGEAARLELVRADAEVASSRIQVRSAELRLSAALSGLYAAVGAPLGRVEPEASLDPPPALPPLDELQEDVIRRHPAIAFAEAERRRTEAQLESEKAQRMPQPTLWMDWFQQPDASQYRFGVSVPVPVFNRRQGQVAEAVAATRQAAATTEQRRVEITAALERAYAMYQVASQQVEISEAGTLREAELAVEAAEAAFRFGERGILEVLDAQRVLRSARLDYLNAQYDRQQALIELEQLRAVDLPGGTP